ncbi:hypothetical protein PRVXT_001815 [Proteinivorax tanatarense]|uniref:Arsenical resistance operon trans-acting repressor ArsD n=1 Tax=Proteinivorax tanatarense TaxID=1260629 RepID=A0AAU7VJ05_9FIRM
MLNIEIVIDDTPKKCCSKGANCEELKINKVIDDFKLASSKDVNIKIIGYDYFIKNHNNKELLLAVEKRLLSLPIVLVNGLPKLFGKFDYKDLIEACSA